MAHSFGPSLRNTRKPETRGRADRALRPRCGAPTPRARGAMLSSRPGLHLDGDQMTWQHEVASRPSPQRRAKCSELCKENVQSRRKGCVWQPGACWRPESLSPAEPAKLTSEETVRRSSPSGTPCHLPYHPGLARSRAGPHLLLQPGACFCQRSFRFPAAYGHTARKAVQSERPAGTLQPRHLTLTARATSHHLEPARHTQPTERALTATEISQPELHEKASEGPWWGTGGHH